MTRDLRCSLFSTSEQSRIGIPTLGDTVDGHTNPPAIVIYIVDAFLSGSGRNEVEEEGDEVETGSIWLLGLLRCYTEMLQTLPEGIRPALVLQVDGSFKMILTRPSQLQPASQYWIFFSQVVSCQHLLQPASGESHLYLQRLRSLAFSCYSQCRRLLPQQTYIKSLTGFGPASTVNSVLSSPTVGVLPELLPGISFFFF